MYNIAATVAGALLAGGAVLYGSYVYVEGRAGDGANQSVLAEADDGAQRGVRSRGGVPEGTRPLSFDEGAPGDRVASGDVPRIGEDDRLNQASRDFFAAGTRGGPRPAPSLFGGGDDAAEVEVDGRDARPTTTNVFAQDDAAIAEAERLEALGAGGVTPEAPSGLRGIGDASEEAPSNTQLRGDGPPPAPVGAPAAVGADTALGTVAEAGAEIGADAPARTAASVPMARNARLTAKPDGDRFARNGALTDKPDTAGYFTENAPVRQPGPCMKADGTRYAGPGTATNPFAASDPCLPRGTAQSYELAQAALPVATASDVGVSVTDAFGVPLGSAFRGVMVPVPPGSGNFGSDYRTDG